MSKRKRKVTFFEETEQPLNWSRAFVSGVFAATFLMAFIDTFYMMGITPFCLESYLGSMILLSPYGAHNWTVGVFATWVVGGIWALLYAYIFEYGVKRANARTGALLGLAHAAVAALLIFPFFETIQSFLGTEPPPRFGFFGLGMGPATFIVLLLGHMLFGMTVGVFYGPVRVFRVRSQVFEPGEESYPPEDNVISERDVA